MDPYKVLGIERTASEQEIKKAYRSLSRKYHPDANVGKPNAKSYEEKFKQIQEAYSMIMDEKQGKSSSYSHASYGSDSAYRSESDTYINSAISFIQNGRFTEALRVLQDIAPEKRNGKWYYVFAIANAGSGNNMAALQAAKRATELEPGNYEYQKLYAQLQNSGFSYQNMQQPYMQYGNYSDSGCLRCCLANILLNLFCGCCGC